MASVKYLKKEIDYLTSAVVSDCINVSFFSKENVDDALAAIVNDIVSVRNEIRIRIADGKRVEKKDRKAFYSQIAKDMLAKSDECFSKLSDLVKEENK